MCPPQPPSPDFLVAMALQQQETARVTHAAQAAVAAATSGGSGSTPLAAPATPGRAAAAPVPAGAGSPLEEEEARMLQRAIEASRAEAAAAHGGFSRRPPMPCRWQCS
jgi:hypothetical protein